MRTTLLSIIAAFLLFVSGKTLMAQPGLPPGDYKRTCQNMRADGSRVWATCQKANGGWRNTSLNYRNCNGRIVNEDGNLRCGQGGYGYPNGAYVGGNRGGLPAGDYRRSCQNIRMNGNRLDATCQGRGGGWHDTSLNNPYSCRSGVVNDDGNLRCER